VDVCAPVAAGGLGWAIRISLVYRARQNKCWSRRWEMGQTSDDKSLQRRGEMNEEEIKMDGEQAGRLFPRRLGPRPKWQGKVVCFVFAAGTRATC
jgi:hypothetical protein